MIGEPRVLVDREFRLGENPLWDARRGRLLWTDIDAGELWSLDGLVGEPVRLYEGPKVGGFTIERDGALMLFRERDIARIDDTGRVESVAAFEDAGVERFNDVIAAPDGSVLAGTIGTSDESGGLFHVASGGATRELFRGTKIANGMGFSPDGRALYWTCSTSARIYRFAFDPLSCVLGERELFHDATRHELGIPDGLTVDSAGGVWSARWGGGCVVRLDPTGEVRGMVELPVPNVTSVAFGGEALGTLLVTTAGGPVFAIETDAVGTVEHRSAIAGG